MNINTLQSPQFLAALRKHFIQAVSSLLSLFPLLKVLQCLQNASLVIASTGCKSPPQRRDKHAAKKWPGDERTAIHRSLGKPDLLCPYNQEQPPHGRPSNRPCIRLWVTSHPSTKLGAIISLSPPYR